MVNTDMSIWNVLKFLLPFLYAASALELIPIGHPDYVHDAAAILKREESFTGELDLQDFETFYWGAPAGNNMIYANLTVYFPEQYERVVAMERFADQLKSVQCAEDMMLEFIDDAAFEYAKDVWNWVNEDVNHTFIMVTNYEGCADNMERLPFVVSNIRYDEAANKAFLKADLKEWEEVAHSYTLNVGHTPLTPAHRMLMSRGVFPRDADFSMSLTSGFDQNLFSATVGDWTTSVDAVVRTVGSLDVDFDIDVSWLKLKSAAMTISPENVAASIQLALTERGKLGKAYTWQDTIVSIPINGIEIAKVVKIGAFLDIDVGFTMQEWEGTATANLGARMELSNAAIVKIDLVNSANNKFSGWTPTFTPIPLTLNAKVEGSAKVFAEPNVKIEASALGKGWNVGLNLQMPYIQADFAAMIDTTGVCNSKKTVGVDVDASVGVELSVQAATKGNEANPFWSQELYSNEWDLFSKCLAFGADNAKPGEVADPKPPKSKSKKPKSKPPKASKTPKPKPKSSKPALTLKPTPKPKKPAATPAKPSKAVSSKTARPTSSNKASSKAPVKSTPDASERPDKSAKPTPSDNVSSKTPSEPTSDASKSAKPSPDVSEKPSKTPKPTSGDDSGTKSQSRASSISEKSDSANSRSKGTSSSTSLHATSTSISTTSMPFRNSSIAASGITKPPSTFVTATLSSVSSSSSSQPDSCPIDGKGEGCNDCATPDIDPNIEALFADQPTIDLPTPITNRTARGLQPRFESHRSVQYQCSPTATSDTSFSTGLTFAPFPQFTDLTRAGTISVSVSDFYQAHNSADCLDHRITHATTLPPLSSGQAKYQFEMEHIYEGAWISNFLSWLEKTEKIPCTDMHAIFFTPRSTNNAGASWAQALMHSLGSTTNQADLVFLWKYENGMKRLLFSDNDIIASTRWRASDAEWKIKKIATVGRAMAYMGEPDIGAKLLDSAKRVEATLNAMVASLPAAALERLGDLGEADEMARRHRRWLNGFMVSRNEVARTSMSSWASEASKEFVKSSPAAAVASASDASRAREWTRTTSLLWALQTEPPRGFDGAKYAPLLQ